jgi:ATP-dependent helicase/nuclease subunit A
MANTPARHDTNRPPLPAGDSVDPNEKQRAASDPGATVWVGASAGTGKTKILTDRVLRLMLPGTGENAAAPTPPEKILCITFTKAAAAEMALRIHEVLSKWAVMEEEKLKTKLTELTGDAPSPEMVRVARRLFARVVDTAGGMKIMTIHSFCQSVLSRFPIEAELSPHFEVMDERKAQDYLAKCQSAMIRDVRQESDSPLATAFTHLTRLLNAEQMENLLTELTGNRSRLTYLLTHEGGYDGVIEKIYAALGLTPGETEKTVLADFAQAQSVHLPDLRAACDALSHGGKSDVDAAEKMQDWLAANNPQPARRAFNIYKGAFLTGKHEIRKRMGTQAAQKQMDNIGDVMLREAEKVLEVHHRLQAIGLVQATADVLRIGAHILALYQQTKDDLALLDYDDLIYRTRDLLSEKSDAAWVLFKLDGGIDHILIDEAQDTNPEQWQVITALTEEFFAGQGRDAETDRLRTLFVVGDEKQSIFSFQRADPAEFARMRDYFRDRTKASDKDWRLIDLQVSFRSTPEVLHFVDTLFALPENRSGLVTQTGAEIRHIPHRAAHPGLVEMWPVITSADEDAVAPENGWVLPLAIRQTEDAGMRLAEKIADTLRGWIDNGEILAARGRPITPGDVMILVRTRNVFVDQCVRALKSRNIPVAGVDRMVLNEQLAVTDLIAAAAFGLMPEDDLTLATFLKTPLVGLDEDDLYRLCRNRETSLYEAVKTHPDYETVARYLARCIDKAQTLPPYGFFAGLLNAPCPASPVSGRHAVLGRLGHDALDPMEELLNACFQYAQQRIVSLQDFLNWFSKGKTEIKRQQEQDENADQVRIMTVHGSKGLQAPVVFLPDTLSHPKDNTQNRDRLLWHAPPYKTALPLWAPRQEMEDPTYTARVSELRRKEEEEYRRLLYVALTRAEDRLYICGYKKKPSSKLPEDCWYSALYRSLQPVAQEIDFDVKGAAVQETPDGLPSPALRLQHRDVSAVVEDAAAPPEKARIAKITTVPDWCRTKPEDDPVPSKPLAPSRILDNEPAARSPLLGKEDKSRFRRGLITHKLLEMLPALPQDGAARENAARSYLSRRVHDLDDAEQADICREVMAVLQHTEFAPIFGPGSEAEVPFHGRVRRKDHQDAFFAVSGVIDRLFVTESDVYAIDYKTNRPPPAIEKHVPEIYLRQMGMYYTTLQHIYPGKTVRCALLWTDGPFLMPLSPELLHGYIAA